VVYVDIESKKTAGSTVLYNYGRRSVGHTEAHPNWGNTLVAVASIGYLISLLLIALDVGAARYLFLPSVLISLLGMPVASYPSGELNAVYDLTMYVSGFLNGGLAILVYAPSFSKG
jgi:hypothetical protein